MFDMWLQRRAGASEAAHDVDCEIIVLMTFMIVGNCVSVSGATFVGMSYLVAFCAGDGLQLELISILMNTVFTNSIHEKLLPVNAFRPLHG